MKTRRGSFWTGMALGAVAGALGGLLYAPKRGNELRDDIKSTVKETGRKAGQAYGDVKETAVTAARNTGERAKTVVDQSKDAICSTADRVKQAMTVGRETMEEKAAEAYSDVKETAVKAGDRARSAVVQSKGVISSTKSRVKEAVDAGKAAAEEKRLEMEAELMEEEDRIASV